MKLRPYQAKDYNSIRDAFSNYKSVCFQSPTGSGKTVIFSTIAYNAWLKGNTSLTLVHRRELLMQTVKKYESFGVKVGVIAAGWPSHPNRKIQVASIQTLARRLDIAPKTRLVIIDECHHASAGSWSTIIQHYKSIGSYLFGCTATPERLDGKGLNTHFDKLICGPSIKDLIEQGYLADARIFTVPAPDLSKVKRIGGDYAKQQLAGAMSTGVLVGNAIEHYQEHADGLPAIAFCCTIQHAELVADQFRAAGYRAASVDGSMTTTERDGIIDGLHSGKLQIVTSCDLISEGLDIPDVAAAILLRPTQSLTLYLQQVGRTLRPKKDGSPAIILDHAGNVLRHGSPKTDRLWSLQGRPVRLRAEKARRQAQRKEAQSRRYKLIRL